MILKCVCKECVVYRKYLGKVRDMSVFWLLNIYLEAQYSERIHPLKAGSAPKL